MRSRREMERASEHRRSANAVSPGFAAFDVAASALIARMTTAPSQGRKVLINNLVVALRISGIWQKLDALYVFAADNSQAALLNWIADQYNASAVSAPTFTQDRGYAGDGAASYVDSTFNPTTASSPKFVQDSAYFGIWLRTNVQFASSIAGFFSTTGTTIAPRLGTDELQGRINQVSGVTSSTTGSVTDGSKLTGVSRSASDALRIAKNGVNVVTGTTTSAALANGALRFGNFGTGTYASHEFAAGIIGGNLTAGEELILYSALQAYMTAVGA